MQKYHSIFILTGAGISAESGLRTFRDGNGLWEDHRIEDVATPEAFNRDPVLVQRFYNDRRRQLLAPEVVPNSGHHALARLETEFEGDLTLVTQNVDDLHERAGSKNVIHMHGELKKMRCVLTGDVFPIEGDITRETQCPCCGKTATLRPHIVWFNEIPFFMEEISEVLHRCDLFIAIGTSGLVYPAAMFVQQAYQAQKIEINPQQTERTGHFNRQIPYPATIAVPRLVEEILLGKASN